MARDVRIFAPESERFGLAIGVVLACEPGAIAARSGDVVQILRVEGVVCGKVHPHPMRLGPAPGEHRDAAGDAQRRGAIGVVEPHPAPRQGIEPRARVERSEEHTSELQSLMRISYAVFCLKKKKKHTYNT